MCSGLGISPTRHNKHVTFRDRSASYVIERDAHKQSPPTGLGASKVIKPDGCYVLMRPGAAFPLSLGVDAPNFQAFTGIKP
jgi:hypothetical protein